MSDDKYLRLCRSLLAAERFDNQFAQLPGDSALAAILRLECELAVAEADANPEPDYGYDEPDTRTEHDWTL